jgi:hypothetical protein
LVYGAEEEIVRKLTNADELNQVELPVQEEIQKIIFRICPRCGAKWLEDEEDIWRDQTTLITTDRRAGTIVEVREHKCGGRMISSGVVL